MADRIFAAVLLAVTLAYGWIAFTIIQAPFQYDPLGPESWPQVLSVIAAACLIAIFVKPGIEGFGAGRATWLRIAAMVAMLFAYAALYQPFGFVISTCIFGALAALMLGAPWKGAAAFGLTAGIAGYVLCAWVLDLNVPEGPLPKL